MNPVIHLGRSVLDATWQKLIGETMHPVANQLVQLQDLCLIRDEQKIATSGSRLQQLDASIRGMTAKLPRDIRSTFEKLRKKDPIVISPVSDGICAGCGMGLSVSHVQAVRIAREILRCPNCARMLYCPSTVVRRVGKRIRRSAPRKVGIARFSSAALMIPRVAANTKEEIIEELAYKMEDAGFVDKGSALVEQAFRREAIVCTAVNHGLAFPHVRGVEGGALTLALGLSTRGIRFDDDGKGLTRIVFFMAIPTAASAFYLKLLAGLAETFAKPDARKALMVPKEPESSEARTILR